MNVQDSFSPNWFQTSLQQAINFYLPYTPSMREIGPNIVSWKHQLNVLSDSDKEKQITYAIEWVTDSSAAISIKQMKLCLRLIEDVALSPRVSTLSKKNFLHRRVSNISNRAFTLQGLENYIQAKYPQLKIFFFNSIPNDLLFSIQFKEHFIDNKDIWLVFQHGKYLHKTLLKLSNVNDCLEITILDSIGMTHDASSLISNDPKEGVYRNHLRSLVERLSEIVTLDKVKTFSKPRQKDGVNCGAFVVFDLETALNLKNEGEALFSDAYDNGMHSDFFKITQYTQEASLMSPICMRKYDDSMKSERQGNCQVLIIAGAILKHALNNSSSYVKERANLEELSDEDEEDGCSIM